MSFNNNKGIMVFGPSSEKQITFKKQYILNSKFIDDNIDLIIWDFDNTLIDIKAYSLHSMSPSFIRDKMTIEQFEWDFPYWCFFRQTVIDLVNNGKRVGIASFGMYNIIRAYMDRIFGINQKYFTVVNIFARCKIDEPLQPNKNGYILNIMEHYHITSPERVLLFDDASSNISAGIEIGLICILIKGIEYQNGKRVCNGLFSPKIMNRISKQLQSPLNSSNPFHVAQLGHVGDRKVSTTMYGRRDKCPMNMKKHIYSDNLINQYKQNTLLYNNIYNTDQFNSDNDNTIININNENNNENNNLNNRINESTIYSEPQFRETTTLLNNNNRNNDICTTCNIYTPVIIVSIILLLIILSLTLYYVFNNLK
jgi:beta-phosphoglucomutase-like phosphatase (HAD superfamily)